MYIIVYNNRILEIDKITAYLNDYIEITSKNEIVTINLSFNSEEFDVNNMEINKKTNIVKYLYWDTTLNTKETYYLFDISKDKVYLTKLDNYKYQIEIDIENPDMIYCPLGENESFNNFKVVADFSFIGN